MAQTAIYEYGKQFVYECEKSRHYFELEDTSSIDKIIQQLQTHTSIDLTNCEYKFVERESGVGYYMSW